MRHQLDLAGRTLSYLDVSSPANHPLRQGQGGLPAVLLLHAFPLAAEMWTPQLASVPSGWRFIAPDLRGFGSSSPDHSESTGAESGSSWIRREPGGAVPWSIDDYARDALALLDHLEIRQAVICGLSMGGYAAFALFRQAPQRVRGLVLADTRPDPDSPSDRAAREESLRVVEREGVAALAESMLPRLLGRTSRETRPAMVHAVRSLATAQPPAAVVPAIVRLMTRPDSTPALAAIGCPTLVVAGEEDEITGPDIARQMHGQVGNAALAVIGHAGHLSSVEQPEAFNEALDRFLAARFRT
jgi:pimeloyl-ACP methyl ester carboxylesterase